MFGLIKLLAKVPKGRTVGWRRGVKGRVYQINIYSFLFSINISMYCSKNDNRKEILIS